MSLLMDALKRAEKARQAEASRDGADMDLAGTQTFSLDPIEQTATTDASLEDTRERQAERPAPPPAALDPSSMELEETREIERRIASTSDLPDIVIPDPEDVPVEPGLEPGEATGEQPQATHILLDDSGLRVEDTAATLPSIRSAQRSVDNYFDGTGTGTGSDSLSMADIQAAMDDEPSGDTGPQPQASEDTETQRRVRAVFQAKEASQSRRSRNWVLMGLLPVLLLAAIAGVGFMYRDEFKGLIFPEKARPGPTAGAPVTPAPPGPAAGTQAGQSGTDAAQGMKQGTAQGTAQDTAQGTAQGGVAAGGQSTSAAVPSGSAAGGAGQGSARAGGSDAGAGGGQGTTPPVDPAATTAMAGAQVEQPSDTGRSDQLQLSLTTGEVAGQQPERQPGEPLVSEVMQEGPTPATPEPSELGTQPAEQSSLPRSRGQATDSAGLRPQRAMGGSGLKIKRKRQVDKVHPKLTRAYQALKSGDEATAEKEYSAVLKRDPTNRDALLGLAAVAVSGADFDRAGQLYVRLLELNPRDSLAQAALVSLKETADPGLAESRIKLLLREEPDAAHLYFTLGNLYARQNRWAKAQEAYFDAYRLQSDNADYAYNLAVALDQMVQRSAALTYYRLALNLSQQRPARFEQAAVRARISSMSAAN